MRPEELMIGDLMIHGFGGIGKITEIDSKTVAIKDDGFDLGDGMNEVSFALNELTPVPLTAEILEKNGFKESKYGEMILDEELGTSEIYLVLEESHDGEYYWWKVNNELIAKIKSVHELQHALRLCGIDKNIEI